jgi:benzoylsuccinyl-CoA thiolase BbsB subunit
MRDVYILGVGQSMFGKQPNRSAPELGAIAASAAIKDAGIDPRIIQVGYGSRVMDASQTAEDILKRVGISKIEMVNTENACASGGTGLHMLWKDITAGFYDIGIVVGAESMTTSHLGGGLVPTARGDLNGAMGITMPSLAGLNARRLIDIRGLTVEDLAYASVKNHRNACLNPYAHYKKVLTTEEVVNDKMISDPITRLMCCPQSDGAAAAILCTREIAAKYTTQPVKIDASIVLSSPYELWDEELTDATLIGLLADKTYETAGIGPEDLDLVELHDAFSPEEIYAYECMRLCKKGETMSFIRSGAAEIGGKCPVNPSGGLQSLGHPLGASGVRVICEVTLQLRGQAEQRQVKDAKVGLAQMVGGSLTNLSAPTIGSMHILTI